MTVLEERGLFWWYHEPIPDRKFAPDSCVTGLLKIDDDGRTTLELDGRLASDRHPIAALLRGDQAELQSKSIEGILKGSNKHVLLLELHKTAGHVSSRGLSYDGYQAANCLVGNSRIPKVQNELSFNRLEIPLDGFEEWLRLGSIEVDRTESTISVSHKTAEDVTYELQGGRLSIQFDITGPIFGKHRRGAVELKESAALIYELSEYVELDPLRIVFGNFEDLFIILTDSEYRLRWPLVRIKDDEDDRQWYFWRQRTVSEAEAPKWHECLTNFIILREKLGEIISKWLEKREIFGPGFYLYLGVRRGMQLYVEHRFVNVIWGLEAFHRKKHGDAGSEKTKTRVGRIVEQVSNNADKKWLKGKLKHSHEPTLEQRLYDIIVEIPIKLDKKRVRAFANECAGLRNEISHFGSQKQGDDYTSFMTQVMKKSAALELIYHTLILHEISVDEKIFNHWIYDGVHSGRNMRTLVEAGLLDEEILKSTVAPVPPAGAAAPPA